MDSPVSTVLEAAVVVESEALVGQHSQYLIATPEQYYR
jgi:hypothetical protein